MVGLQVIRDDEYCESEESKLRSRGLCLVPLSCMSYINLATHPAATNAAIWPSPNFN